MATLADELLQDFEDSGSEDGHQDNSHLFAGDEDDEAGNANTNGSNGIHASNDMDLDGDDEEPGDEDEMQAPDVSKLPVEDAEEAKAKIEKMQLGGVNDVRSVAVLMKTLAPVLEKIGYYQTLAPEKQTTLVGSIEDNPEYHLLTQSNTLATSIDTEVMLVYKFLRDHYSIRFPELETLVTNPIDYAKVTAILGNGPMDSSSIKQLQDSKDNRLGLTLRAVLDGPSVMIVTVEATTTKGREMTPAELERVMRACDMMLALDKAKKTLTDYVQSRMNIFAPNLTALIGSLTAAQLLNFAGGLTGLAKTPSCNIAPLGSKRAAGTGMATNVGIRQQGFLYHSPIIREIPADLRRQAMRIVSAKIVLAARIDRVHQSPNGALGEELKSSCLDRLEKLTEPAPNKGHRALPAPDDKPAKKRGGRTARKAKEALAMTDLRKAQNRMIFGKEEKEVGYGTGDGTKGLGMIGQANEGRIRNLQVDQRTRAKLSAKNKGWGGATPVGGASSSLRGFGQFVQGIGGIDLRGKGLRASGVGSSSLAASGTASTIAFTPVQGLELVDPKTQADMSRKRKAEEDRWFKGGTFTQVSKDGNAGSSMGPPSAPARKRVDTGAEKQSMAPPSVPGGS